VAIEPLPKFPFLCQNSNLVLQADRKLIDRRDKDESTGEVLPLEAKRLKRQRMGDRG
jgi:pre-mRNA-splicing helicase BRR2